MNLHFAQSAKLNLIPVPAKVNLLPGKFEITDSLKVGIVKGNSTRVNKYANRFLSRLSGRTGLFLVYPFVQKVKSGDSADVLISFEKSVSLNNFPDESYNLKIKKDKIFLSAGTDIGILRGLETLLQLLDRDSTRYFFQNVEIEDSPRFKWRGLMIDVCRHFMPPDVIYRNLDAMAAVKMNVLHLHLSDDQGFRIECKTFPKLHTLASDGLYFTQEQIKNIIRYADERGIRVIPEFDIPGHATSWLVAYPEYASLPGPYKLQREWGIFDPVFDPTQKKTYEFFDAFFNEMAKLFPDDYIHIGGDENNGNQWRANERIQEFMKEKGLETTGELQAYFNTRIAGILKKYNKKMVGWDEILHPGIQENIVIQSWRGKEYLINAAKSGYNVILSNGYYIDLIQPAEVHYLNDPLSENADLTAEEKRYVLGGEATMWSEFVSPETIDSRIWPRTAAIAERFWSPQNIKDVEDMYRRLDVVSLQLEELGLTHIKNYAMMLRRLANSRDIKHLKILVDVLEPVKNYNRNRLRKHTQQSPLTRVVDAARPDAKTARLFRRNVDEFIHNGNTVLKDEIISRLKLWKANHSKLTGVIKSNPALKEILPQSENLKKVSETGLDAINFMINKIDPPENWKEKALGIIEHAKEPVAQTELMIVSAIEKLVKYVTQQKD